LSSTSENVDIIYNGLSDSYKTLYPFIEDANNEGGMTLLTKEELGNKQASPYYEVNAKFCPTKLCANFY
jgi:hypothetical protein